MYNGWGLGKGAEKMDVKFQVMIQICGMLRLFCHNWSETYEFWKFYGTTRKRQKLSVYHLYRAEGRKWPKIDGSWMNGMKSGVCFYNPDFIVVAFFLDVSRDGLSLLNQNERENFMAWQ